MNFDCIVAICDAIEPIPASVSGAHKAGLPVKSTNPIKCWVILRRLFSSRAIIRIAFFVIGFYY